MVKTIFVFMRFLGVNVSAVMRQLHDDGSFPDHENAILSIWQVVRQLFDPLKQLRLVQARRLGSPPRFPVFKPIYGSKFPIWRK